jgi:hypothetical protein
MQNLKQIYFALEAYANDNNGNYPNKNDFLGLKMLVDGQYLKSSCVKCPGDKETINSSYRYIGGLNKNSGKNTPICWDKKDNHKYRDTIFGNVLYLGGHIEGYSYEKWSQFLESTSSHKELKNRDHQP